MKNRIYLDYAATAPVLPEVLEAMLPFFVSSFGNPSGIHGTGREVRKAIEQARRQTAKAIGSENSEICFTSGGTESDNLAVQGTAYALREKGNHLITSAIEHPAVINTCKWLEKQGFRVTYLQPDRYGTVTPETVEAAIRTDTILVSINRSKHRFGIDHDSKQRDRYN